MFDIKTHKQFNKRELKTFKITNKENYLLFLKQSNAPRGCISYLSLVYSHFQAL